MLRSQFALPLLVSALSFAAGCGDSTSASTDTNATNMAVATSGGEESAVPDADATGEAPREVEIGSLRGMMAAESARLCTNAYDSARAMVDSMREQDPSVPKAVSRAPFESGCAQLPITHQRCLSVEYVMEHAEECNVILQSPEMNEFREAMQRARDAE